MRRASGSLLTLDQHNGDKSKASSEAGTVISSFSKWLEYSHEVKLQFWPKLINPECTALIFFVCFCFVFSRHLMISSCLYCIQVYLQSLKQLFIHFAVGIFFCNSCLHLGNRLSAAELNILHMHTICLLVWMPESKPVYN